MIYKFFKTLFKNDVYSMNTSAMIDENKSFGSLSRNTYYSFDDKKKAFQQFKESPRGLVKLFLVIYSAAIFGILLYLLVTSEAFTSDYFAAMLPLYLTTFILTPILVVYFLKLAYHVAASNNFYRMEPCLPTLHHISKVTTEFKAPGLYKYNAAMPSTDPLKFVMNEPEVRTAYYVVGENGQFWKADKDGNRLPE